MANTLTAEEQRQEYIQQMGDALGRQFHALWQEVAWLYSKWAEYLELFGTSPSRVELLNSAAPGFFRIVQDTLWEDTILHIARLTDRPKSFGKANLTICGLPSLVDDATTKESVSNLVQTAVQAADFCRDWRNRHIAHRDLALALKEGAIPLEPASRQDVKRALESIANVLNAVTAHYGDSTTAFDVKHGSGGAVSLLYVLNDGLKADAARRERIRRGQFDHDDLHPAKL
jgi:hypothetical protein